MEDRHIHLEGPYTDEWIDRYVATAVERGVEEICLLEHCYRFREFAPMYGAVKAYSQRNAAWIARRVGTLDLADYLRLVERTRARSFPVRVQFGLEVCYFHEHEDLIYRETNDKGFDFLTGSIHFVDGMAYDGTPEDWDGVDIDQTYRRFFEQEIQLAQSGLFTGMGHPDAIKLFGHQASYPLQDTYEALAKALAKTGTYAEESGGISVRGTCGAVLGMAPELLAACLKNGVTVRTASDAHRPEDVGANIATLQSMVQEAQTAIVG